MSRSWLLFIGLCFLFIPVLFGQAYAQGGERSVFRDSLQKSQDTIPRRVFDSLRAETLRDSAHVRLMQDSLFQRGVLDTLPNHAEDTLHSHSDTTHIHVRASIDVPLFSEAKDSIIEDFSDGQKMMYYFGDVKVNYGNLEMKAAYMEYNADTQTVFARGVPDSTGTLQGKPEMKEGNMTYTMESVYYNFNSKKAKIFNMITQEGEGIMHGTVIKKMPDNSFNISKGKYTTCDAEHPHFYLHMTSAKVVHEPSEKTVFGPSFVVIEDVPTPIALPFGFVPKRPERSGGLLMPSYGEEVSRGFFLKGLGYYFVMGNHLDFAVTGDIYSLGSWNAQLTSRYKSIYKFDGSLNINISNNVSGEKGSKDYVKSGDFSFKWTHNQDAKARPGTTFRASVDFSTPANNRFNATDIQQARENKASSSITYGKTFIGTPFNLSVNLQHSQNMRDSSYAFTLPNFTFTMNRIYPFKRKERVGKERIYEKFALTYNTAFNNKINFKSSDFKDGELWSKFQNGMSHNFGITLPSFTLLKYLQFSPGVSYSMNWHFREKEVLYNEETGKEETIYTDPFSSFGVTQDVSGSLAMSTRLYGMFDFGKKGALRAIRHMVTPQISLNYHPNMRTPMNGFTSFSYVDSTGKAHVVDYNIYEGASTVGVSAGAQAAGLSFSLGNNLEAKVRNRKDTANGGEKKIKLIDNFSISSSYNFLADSMKLAPFALSMNTTIMEKLSLSAGGTLDPYAINRHGSNKISTFNIVQEGGLRLVRLTAANLSFSYQFSGKSAEGSAANTYKRVYTHPITGEFIPEGWVYYMPPDLPWSVNLNYTYSYSVQYQYVNENRQKINNHVQTLGVNSQIKLTKDFNMSLSTGLDMMKMKLSTTSLTASYDLHCFQISVQWIPQGKWSQWSFRIQAKSAALADLLKYDKKASFWDQQ